MLGIELTFASGGEVLALGGRTLTLPILAVAREYTRRYCEVMLEVASKSLREIGEWAGEEVSRRVGTAFGIEGHADEPYRLLIVDSDTNTALDLYRDAWLLKEFWALYLAIGGWLSPWYRRSYKAEHSHKRLYFTPGEMYKLLTDPPEGVKTAPDHLQESIFKVGRLAERAFDREEQRHSEELKRLLRKADELFLEWAVWELENDFLVLYGQRAFEYRINQVWRKPNPGPVCKSNRRASPGGSDKYISPSLLPLAWVEVKWCLDHNQHVAFCEQCGGAFPLTRPYKRSAYLCSPECRKARRIEQVGGPEKQRELWRQAKRASRSRLEKGERRRKRGFGGSS